MNNTNKNKGEKQKIDNVEYEILGNLFVGDLLNMPSELDNASQNLLMYMDLNKIKKAKKENKQ
jgi:hypothetical protein